MKGENYVMALRVICVSIVAANTLNAQTTSIYVDASKVENKISPWLYGSCIEDVNHEIYGGLYDQKIFGESFEESIRSPDIEDFSTYGGFWSINQGVLNVAPSSGPKMVYDAVETDDAEVQTQIRFNTTDGNNAGLLVRVTDPGIGADNFNGYEINISNDGKKAALGKHRKDWQLLKQVDVDINPLKWNLLIVRMKGPRIEVLINGKVVIDFEDRDAPLLSGKIAIRPWNADASYQNLKINTHKTSKTVPFVGKSTPSVSSMWDIIQTADAKATFLHDSKHSYNSKHSQMIELSAGTGTVGIANRGLNRWGIAVQSQKMMQGYVYLKSSGLKGSVKVALQSVDGSVEYAVQQIENITNNWAKYSFELTSPTTDPNARFAIYIDTPAKVWIDQAVLMSTGKEQFKGLPLRNDIGQAMVNQGLTFLRYGGTMVNVPDYRFKNMIGNRSQRPIYKGHWYQCSTNGFGIEEFLQFCESAGFVPSFAVSVEESAQDMADMIEYLNGPATSTWGKKRADAGHPAPYNVKYIEIGNEEVIHADDRAMYQRYIDQFNRIYGAIRAKDPNVEFINAAWWREESPENMEMVFRALNGKAAYWDYHPWADDVRSGIKVERELNHMRDLFMKWDPNTQMKCALFEENGTTHSMERALGHVSIQNAARRCGEFLLTTCAANALQPYMQNDNGWDQGQIFFTPSQVWAMPPYYAQQMASRNHKTLRVYSRVENSQTRKTSEENEDTIDVTATRDEDGNELVLHIANINAQTIKTNLNISGFTNIKQIKVITLSSDLQGVNTPEQPERIIPTEKILYHVEDLLYEFPAHSYTIMIYQR